MLLVLQQSVRKRKALAFSADLTGVTEQKEEKDDNQKINIYICNIRGSIRV